MGNGISSSKALVDSEFDINRRIRSLLLFNHRNYTILDWKDPSNKVPFNIFPLLVQAFTFAPAQLLINLNDCCEPLRLRRQPIGTFEDEIVADDWLRHLGCEECLQQFTVFFEDEWGKDNFEERKLISQFAPHLNFQGHDGLPIILIALGHVLKCDNLVVEGLAIAAISTKEASSRIDVQPELSEEKEDKSTNTQSIELIASMLSQFDLLIRSPSIYSDLTKRLQAIYIYALIICRLKHVFPVDWIRDWFEQSVPSNDKCADPSKFLEAAASLSDDITIDRFSYLKLESLLDEPQNYRSYDISCDFDFDKILAVGPLIHIAILLARPEYLEIVRKMLAKAI